MPTPPSAPLRCRTHLEDIVDLHEPADSDERGWHHGHHQTAGRVELGAGERRHPVAQVLERRVLQVLGDAQHAAVDKVLDVLPNRGQGSDEVG